MHPLIAENSADISRLCREHHIRRLEVFGSAARATDFDPARSDADFLVEFEPEAKRGLHSYFAFKAALEAVLQRTVDLVEAKAVRNPYLLEGINSAREVVYAA
jgi:predicted nucleotidyltransferase